MAGGPDYAGKPRPVLILQDDSFAGTASVTVCLLTSRELDAPLFRIALPAGPVTGLREPSWAMADKITTVLRTKLGERIGVLASGDLAPINRAIMAFLGLGGATG